MAAGTIRELFASDISRVIEEVIKVDQVDEAVVRQELSEYVMTRSIRSHFVEILERYEETPRKPHEGTAVWVSGFFGSGKSSFAKYLGLGLANRPLMGEGAGSLLGQVSGDNTLRVLLHNINEKIPTEAVIFDVSTDRGIRTGNQSLTEIMYRLFLQRLGYARDLDLAELEITLEGQGRLEMFRAAFQQRYGKDWDAEKGKVAFAVQQASCVMHDLEPATYPTADSWREAAARRADITPGDLAARCIELMGRRRPGRNLVFIIDEVGQFVARDVQKMLDLQAVVQNLGRVGRGRLWIVVTSQEKLSELVGGLDDRRVELARLIDRFPLQVHLEPSDISEVTARRVLDKNAAGDQVLRELFQKHRNRLADHTRLTADIRLPELDADSFCAMYPLLPYQVDLIIQVVSGLRTQGGASKHVGGANRTIIKLAQQLLIHPEVDLAGKPVGTLATLDRIYDLVANNIGSEIRGKIDDVAKKVAHPLAPAVAKAICLLQYVRSVHRTPQNIAAALHPAVDADSRLAEVKAALEQLEKALFVRQGEDGYRIPTPAEDDWERQRGGIAARSGDVSRLYAETLISLWQPVPAHVLNDVKSFRAGLVFRGQPLFEGDIPFHLFLAQAGADYDHAVEEARAASQSQPKAVYWVAALDDAIDTQAVEWHRSKEMLSRKERGARTGDETALVAEERIRQRRHQDEVKRLLKKALLDGTVFFRGNDRSPDDRTTEVGRAAEKVLSVALPEVYDRFAEAAARVTRKDLDALMATDNLRGLPPVFWELGLVQDQGGKTVFRVDSGPLAEVLARIENRTAYGETATGRWLADEFAGEPFGWEFDAVRLLAVALLRAGKVDATSRGQTIDSAMSLDARNTFPNNNLFKQASFRPRVGIEFTTLVEAADHFREVFGREIPELEQAAVASAITTEVQRHEADLQEAHTLLVQHRLPGADVLRAAVELARTIRSGSDDRTILTFNGAYRELKDGIRRAADVNQELTEPRLHDLDRARDALDRLWPILEHEPDLSSDERRHAERLLDLMRKETFFRDLPAIDQHAKALETAYGQRHAAALKARSDAYSAAVEELRGFPGWDRLTDPQRDEVASPLVRRAVSDGCARVPLAELRADRLACPALLDEAKAKVLSIIGDEVVTVSASAYFKGGVTSEEQLDAAIDGLRQECLEAIGAGKKVLVR